MDAIIHWVDWGSFPDYLAAGGTIGALYFAYRAVKAAKGANDRQDQQLKVLLTEREEAKAEQRRSQAEKVAAWLSGPRRDTGTDGQVLLIYGLWVQNTSPVPIYGFAAYLTDTDQNGVALKTVQRYIMPPGAEPLWLPLSLTLTDKQQNDPGLICILCRSEMQRVSTGFVKTMEGFERLIS